MNEQASATRFYVLVQKAFPNDYLAQPAPFSVEIEQIGKKGSGHFAEDLAAVEKFDSKDDALAFLDQMQPYDKTIFARSEWKVERYVVFEQRVLEAYLARRVKEREALLNISQIRAMDGAMEEYHYKRRHMES